MNLKRHFLMFLNLDIHRPTDICGFSWQDRLSWTILEQGVIQTFKTNKQPKKIDCSQVEKNRFTCAPWRTRTSVPLLSIEMSAASSTSISVDKSFFKGFEKIAFSACITHQSIHVGYAFCKTRWVFFLAFTLHDSMSYLQILFTSFKSNLIWF